jgi:murein L,D-transpeptidase YcbB/YkuD
MAALRLLPPFLVMLLIAVGQPAAVRADTISDAAPRSPSSSDISTAPERPAAPTGEMPSVGDAFPSPTAGDAIPAPPAAVAASAAALGALLAGDGPLKLGAVTLDRDLLAGIYRKRDFQPIWQGEREAGLRIAIAAAALQGLDPAAYAVTEPNAAFRELLLTDAFLRYASDLARGRVTPTDVETDWLMAAPSFDGPATLERAVTGDVQAVLAALLPDHPGYGRLRDALALYRALAAGPAWPELAVDLPLKRGDSGPGVQSLRRRLAAEGYAVDPAGTVFDDKLAAALKVFQARHGIQPDGDVGKATLVALNVPAAARIKQIRLNLERWRALPRDWAERRIEVNVPAATFALYDAGTPDPVMTMRTVVGAVDHPTPILRARMLSILLNPPWNVPASIVKNELRPAMHRDPTYLERNGYAYVEHNGIQQIQQLPGPKNALGRIKFELPNDDDIYLHDTPSHSYFARSRRQLSHGCVRLEDPRRLATYLLQPSAIWTTDSLNAAIATGETRRIGLPHSLPVYILYWTAFVDPDGTIEFRDDVYGRDHRLAEALGAHQAGPTALIRNASAG